MYSVVLLMALSGSADAPTLGWGCKGCNGCGGCVGCTGCEGCHGCGGCKGCHGGFKLFGGKGCCGGHHGCCGGCDGCFGGCKGCKGCHGGFKLFGGKGCCGGCHGCGGCTGCCGGTVIHGHGSVIVTPSETVITEAAAPATIVVTLPAQAKLSIDGNSTTSTSERRVFVSPSLEAGQEYYYTLKAEINGQVKEERVTVKAGQEVNVKIELPAAVASK